MPSVLETAAQQPTGDIPKHHAIHMVNPNAFALRQFALEKENILGKEMFFAGNVRQNNFFNTTEFIVDDAREAQPEEVIGKLESQQE